MWQTSTFMWQTMANPRINLSFGDAWYSDMYHPFMMILGRIFRSIHQATRFTGTFRVKNCEGVVIFGSPRTIFGSGSKSWLRRTVSQNVKISYFLKSILPKSERIKRVLFSGYGKFPKSGSKFQSVTINVFYVYIYIIFVIITMTWTKQGVKTSAPAWAHNRVAMFLYPCSVCLTWVLKYMTLKNQTQHQVVCARLHD